jgi:hypothetical protein
MTAHTPDGGGLTEAERRNLALARHGRLALTDEQRTAVEHIKADAYAAGLAARATHADPRETEAAALDEAADDVPEFIADRVTWGDGTEFIAATAVQRELRARAADLRAGVREGRDT